MSTAFVNGLIHGHPSATAVLVDGATITAIGGDDLAIGVATVIDLAGRPLFPGFQDSHAHPSMAGIYLVSCNLAETSADEDAYLRVIDDYAARSDKPWITGAGWLSPISVTRRQGSSGSLPVSWIVPV